MNTLAVVELVVVAVIDFALLYLIYHKEQATGKTYYVRVYGVVLILCSFGVSLGGIVANYMMDAPATPVWGAVFFATTLIGLLFYAGINNKGENSWTK